MIITYVLDNILAPDQSWGRFAAVSAKEFGELVCSLHPWILFPGPPPARAMRARGNVQKVLEKWISERSEKLDDTLQLGKRTAISRIVLVLLRDLQQIPTGDRGTKCNRPIKGYLDLLLLCLFFPIALKNIVRFKDQMFWWPVSISRVLKYDWGCPSFWVQLMKMEANYLHRKLSTMSSPWFLLALTLGPGPGCAAGPVWWSGADLLTNWDTKHPVLAIITCQQKPMISATCVVNPYDIQHRILIFGPGPGCFSGWRGGPKKMEQSQPKSDGVIHFGCSIHTQIATFQIDEFLEFIVSSLYPFIRIIYAQNDDNYFHSRWCTIVS